jgi:hypothetical protein
MLTVVVVTVMLPGGVLLGALMSRLLSMNMKSLGGAAQISGVLAPGVLLIRIAFKVNNVPAPLNGVMPSFEKADIRTVLVVPGPVFKTLPDTVQLSAVRPAAASGGT